MIFRGIENQETIFKKWSALVNCDNDIKSDVLKMSTAIVLENAQEKIDEQFKLRKGRGLLLEDAGMSNIPTFGPDTPGTSIAATARDGSFPREGDARVPSIVIPMIRRIYPQLLAHKLVGVQPMQGPIGMAFAFRARYGRFGRGPKSFGQEIGYLNTNAAFTGKPQFPNKYNNVPYDGSEAVGDGVLAPSTTFPPDGSEYFAGAKAKAQDQGTVNQIYVTAGNLSAVAETLGVDPSALSAGQVINLGKASGYTADPQHENIPAESTAADYFKCFLGDNGVSPYGGNSFGAIGDGADTSDAENWAVGRDMPEAGFEILKATVTAKTRKLGIQLTRETEEDMKAMQGINAQQEVSQLISYEIAQEIDRQLLGEIVQSAIRAGNTVMWDPAKADGRNQNERINTLYTEILRASASIAVKSRRGAANWCVASPGAAALLESNIVNPLGVSGGLGNASAFGKEIDNGIGVVEIGALRNGTIKLYRDAVAGGDYVLLGFKGQQIYDAGIIYLPYIPLELNQALDPFTMNPITAARTRYGVTTNLFGAGQYYCFMGIKGLQGGYPVTGIEGQQKVFVQ
jgi:hypothetical protein